MSKGYDNKTFPNLEREYLFDLKWRALTIDKYFSDFAYFSGSMILKGISISVIVLLNNYKERKLLYSSEFS